MLRYELVPVLTWRWRAPLVLALIASSAFGFVTWAPWSSAISPQECAERYARQVPAE